MDPPSSQLVESRSLVSFSSGAWRTLAGFQVKITFMELALCKVPRGRPSEDTGMPDPGHLPWLSGSKSLITLFILDLAIQTGIQDIDLAFVCHPRLSSKQLDPPGNKRYLCAHRKRV